jgi:hypothetical protein
MLAGQGNTTAASTSTPLIASLYFVQVSDFDFYMVLHPSHTKIFNLIILSCPRFT